MNTRRGVLEFENGQAQLSEIQRARILTAMADVASEHGVGYATVARIVARSGVSRRTFYEQFADREGCFLAAFEEAAQRIAAVVIPAYSQPRKWRERVRGGLAALLELLEREPAVARLVMVEALGAGPKALERRRRYIAQVVAIVDTEGREAKLGDGPPPLTGEGVVGGVLSLIHSRLTSPLSIEGASKSPEGCGLHELLNPLVSLVVAPYLGPAAGQRELAQPIPSPTKGTRKAAADPLRDLKMRLTYRTIRVLLAIGELSGPDSRLSNRQVGDAAGIRDQGQVSKLLARLQQLGLVENAVEPLIKGEPNAWRLTRLGSEVSEVLSL